MKESDSSYIGKNSWDPDLPVREISDSYVKRQFLEQAKNLLGDLEKYRLTGSKIPLDDEDPAKSHQGQARWVADSHNPSWYRELYWRGEHTFPRTAPYKRMKNPKTKVRYNVNRASNSQVRQWSSIIRRDKIKKALEEIINGQDEELKFYVQRVRRKRLNSKTKKYEHFVKPKRHYRGRYETIMRELIVSRLTEGYQLEGNREGDPRFNFNTPNNTIRAYFGLEELSERELWEASVS